MASLLQCETLPKIPKGEYFTEYGNSSSVYYKIIMADGIMEFVDGNVVSYNAEPPISGMYYICGKPTDAKPLFNF